MSEKKEPTVIGYKRHLQLMDELRKSLTASNLLVSDPKCPGASIEKIKSLEDIIEKLKRGIENSRTTLLIPPKAIEALKFYANKGNYRLIKSFTHYTKVGKDCGVKARGVLVEINN